MVNANEWLDEKIPKLQRAQATHLTICRQCQNGHTPYQNGCSYCKNINPNNFSNPPKYHFDNTILEGELDLNDFVNLQYLYVYGVGPDQDQQQKLINIKIDKCNKLTTLQFNNLPFSKITVGENKQLIADHNRLKNQVEKLTSMIRNIKGFSLGDIKAATKKMQEENLEYQVAIIKSKLTEDCQLLLETLLEAQQEVLQNDSTFARKQLEKFKNRLSDEITAEEIQELLGKIVEINELEVQLNNLKIQGNK
ncbi:41429_t:CDS:1 [Gigaspora margarita]|uniref:41429_t:CDS:1 n=1 Tax=Gigaspora margarita TaxID=4874 RepID=A0ABN7UZG9_GIGMA|nr:41429_t:CDS:1 [Gigaspora margarita]